MIDFIIELGMGIAKAAAIAVMLASCVGLFLAEVKNIVEEA